MDRVKVIWEDATAYDGHYTLEDAQNLQPKQLESIGWLVRDDKSAMVLATSKITEGNGWVSQVLLIPKRGIVKVDKG